MASLASEFQTELATKTDVLEKTRTQLRASTRDLAEQRKEIAVWRSKVAEVDEREQRVRNLERALEDEDQFDWTGRTEVDGSPALREAGPAFTYRGPASTLSNLPAGILIEFDADPPPPAGDADANSLAHLLRLQSWYARVMGLLEHRIERLAGGNAEQELRLRKVVAHCCGVEPDRIESMLDGLLAALESCVPSQPSGFNSNADLACLQGRIESGHGAGRWVPAARQGQVSRRRRAVKWKRAE